MKKQKITKKPNVKLYKKAQKVIPIFFATDDNYMPFLEVSLRSLIANASKEYKYIVHVLNSGLKKENIELVKRLENENFTIDFCDVSESIQPIRNKLKNLYHFGLAAWYRLFIQSLFPQYDKVLYLDCDIIVLGDISKLYNTQLGNNLVAAIECNIIRLDPVFSEYTKEFCGIHQSKYFNSGILVMNLKEFRKDNIEDRFIYLINKYNFDVIDPDQAYLNVLTHGKIKYLPNGWNKEAVPTPLEGKLNIVHYALYKKPWQYDDVIDSEYFWHYASQSPFYEQIKSIKENFNDEMRAKKEKANIDILEHATRVIKSEKTFVKCLANDINWPHNLVLA